MAVHHKSVVADLAYFLETFRVTQTIVERVRRFVERGVQFSSTPASTKELEVIRGHSAAMSFFAELQLILFGRHRDQSHHQKINEVLTLDQAAQAIEAAKFFLENEKEITFVCDMFVLAASVPLNALNAPWHEYKKHHSTPVNVYRTPIGYRAPHGYGSNTISGDIRAMPSCGASFSSAP